MSAVDVLAVMDRHLQNEADALYRAEQKQAHAVVIDGRTRKLDEAIEARAAVAELIEAARLAEAHDLWCITAKANGCYRTSTERNIQNRYINDKLRAALARVGGES